MAPPSLLLVAENRDPSRSARSNFPKSDFESIPPLPIAPRSVVPSALRTSGPLCSIFFINAFVTSCWVDACPPLSASSFFTSVRVSLKNWSNLPAKAGASSRPDVTPAVPGPPTAFISANPLLILSWKSAAPALRSRFSKGLTVSSNSNLAVPDNKESRELPTFPTIVSKLLEACSNTFVSFDIEETIASVCF